MRFEGSPASPCGHKRSIEDIQDFRNLTLTKELKLFEISIWNYYFEVILELFLLKFLIMFDHDEISVEIMTPTSLTGVRQWR